MPSNDRQLYIEGMKWIKYRAYL